MTDRPCSRECARAAVVRLVGGMHAKQKSSGPWIRPSTCKPEARRLHRGSPCSMVSAPQDLSISRIAISRAAEVFCVSKCCETVSIKNESVAKLLRRMMRQLKWNAVFCGIDWLIHANPVNAMFSASHCPWRKKAPDDERIKHQGTIDDCTKICQPQGRMTDEALPLRGIPKLREKNRGPSCGCLDGALCGAHSDVNKHALSTSQLHLHFFSLRAIRILLTTTF